MISLKLFQQSKTTLLISQHLMPLLIITVLAVLSSVGMFGLMFYPAQERLAQVTAQLQAAQQTQEQTQAAQRAQGIISTTWKALSDYQEFMDLSLDIADLAKRNHVQIPGMGYDFKPLTHKLAAKGTFAFEAQGDYEAIRKFIYELEKRWPYLFIEKLSVESSKKKDGVLFRITVSTFLKEFPNILKKTKA
jgi:ABC-type multidrug transport system fused ATPase/permease subunit